LDYRLGERPAAPGGRGLGVLHHHHLRGRVWRSDRGAHWGCRGPARYEPIAQRIMRHYFNSKEYSFFPSSTRARNADLPGLAYLAGRRFGPGRPTSSHCGSRSVTVTAYSPVGAPSFGLYVLRENKPSGSTRASPLRVNDLPSAEIK